jgi:hypothetical protein
MSARPGFDTPYPLMTVTRKPITGESTKETVKTIAQGMPGDSGVTVVTMLVCFLLCTRGCGRGVRPAFPAPSDFGGGMFTSKTRADARRDREAVAEHGGLFEK